MAATQLDSSFTMSGDSGPGSRSISRTRDILIETMQLVEPRKAVPVPNHLLETKIYSKVAKNSIIQAQPCVLHFGGLEPGVMQKQVFELANVSTEVERMHIIPPQTKYFYVKYTKGDRLVPGLALECTVEFTPDEFRYYYDCIRVHCRGEENLVIPIHAYPVMNTADFPKIVTFPPVPVGHTRSKILPLRCQAPIDFEFQFTYVQPHPAFRVEPLAGVVPANGEVDVVVTFSPSEFSTACMKLQLVISQFNAKPLVCTFTGSSAPGLAKKLVEEAYESEPSDLTHPDQTLDPRAISPLDRARYNRKAKESKKSAKPPFSKEVERDGVKFPEDLDTPYAVAQVLNQQPGKLRIKDLREAVITKKGSSGPPTRQMKEAMFEMAVRKDVYEERQNQLRWQVKVGDQQISQKARHEVLQGRLEAWTLYKRKRGDPVEDEEYHRRCTSCTFRRTHRECSNIADESAKFDMYKNDPWAVKHAILYKFQQAARKVIIRLRADYKLKHLRQMIIDWGEKKYNQRPSSYDKELKDLQTTEEEEELNLQVSRVKSFTFPTYVAPLVKDDMAVDALGPVAYQPTEVVVKKKVPFHNLKVPQQFVLMGYKPHIVHDSSQGYVPPRLAKPLRTGAEEEIITLGDAVPTMAVVDEGDLRLEDYESKPTTPAPAQEVTPIKPPAAMFEPIQYPPLHIFNPAPGLQVYQPALPYAETDSDFHLCPLPRYTSADPTNPHMSTQKQYLDREDTIRGVMTWKRFPSQGLTSLSNTPTLSGVWVPRWQDPFNGSLLPEEVPELYSGLADDDKAAIVDDSENKEGDEVEGVSLTPEMVLAEFPLIEPAVTPEEKHKKDNSFPHGSKMPSTNIPVASNGPVARERREQELDYFLKKKYNRLGNKIQGKIHHQNSLKTNPDLILK